MNYTINIYIITIILVALARHRVVNCGCQSVVATLIALPTVSENKLNFKLDACLISFSIWTPNAGSKEKSQEGMQLVNASSQTCD